jgi:hypothetical protein
MRARSPIKGGRNAAVRDPPLLPSLSRNGAHWLTPFCRCILTTGRRHGVCSSRHDTWHLEILLLHRAKPRDRRSKIKSPARHPWCGNRVAPRGHASRACTGEAKSFPDQLGRIHHRVMRQRTNRDDKAPMRCLQSGLEQAGGPQACNSGPPRPRALREKIPGGP